MAVFFELFITISLQMKRHRALDDFLQRNPSRFMFGGINIDAWSRPALKLFASLCGQDDQTVFGINLWRLRFYRFSFFANCSHKMFLLTSELGIPDY